MAVRSVLRVISILAWPALGLYAQTDLVVNGSFELGLSGWSFGAVNDSGASGTCSYNAVTAPGIETLTSTPGFPATNGTGIVLGSISSTTAGTAVTSCTLYQDVAVPTGTAALTLKFDLGAKAGVDGCNDTGAFVGLYSTSAVPGLSSTPVAGGFTQHCISTPNATLVTFTVPKTAAAVAGTTVRIAFINAADDDGHEVIGIDNVQLLATAAVPTVTSVNPNSGSPAGGNTVTITGTNFTGATSVTFGGAAASFTVVNATTITATVPSGAAGSASVIVTTPGGSNSANTLYAYVVLTPTLGEWGMIGMTGLLMLYGWSSLRRQGGKVGTA